MFVTEKRNDDIIRPKEMSTQLHVQGVLLQEEEDGDSSAGECADSPSPRSHPYQRSSQGEDLSYRRRRDKNNQASRRSRQKRKEKFEQSKRELVELESRNNSLKMSLEQLEELRNKYEEKLKSMCGLKTIYGLKICNIKQHVLKQCLGADHCLITCSVL